MPLYHKASWLILFRETIAFCCEIIRIKHTLWKKCRFFLTLKQAVYIVTTVLESVNLTVQLTQSLSQHTKSIAFAIPNWNEYVVVRHSCPDVPCFSFSCVELHRLNGAGGMSKVSTQEMLDSSVREGTQLRHVTCERTRGTHISNSWRGMCAVFRFSENVHAFVTKEYNTGLFLGTHNRLFCNASPSTFLC
jgi:hypothetical protein